MAALVSVWGRSEKGRFPVRRGRPSSSSSEFNPCERYESETSFDLGTVENGLVLNLNRALDEMQIEGDHYLCRVRFELSFTNPAILQMYIPSNDQRIMTVCQARIPAFTENNFVDRCRAFAIAGYR